MAKYELIMPKMGESIMEATILSWSKKEGDRVELDETILEIATDKVDSEIPSPVEGVIRQILFQPDEVVEIGKVIAIIETEVEQEAEEELQSPVVAAVSAPDAKTVQTEATPVKVGAHSGDRFYSPLVRNIAQAEGIDSSELDHIEGSGMNGRVTKKDILSYVERKGDVSKPAPNSKQQGVPVVKQEAEPVKVKNEIGGNVEIIEMDRMRKMIADHMVMSKRVSPHVTSFVEVDVTNLVLWRERSKGAFEKKYGTKITFTPIFVEAIAKAIADYPLINISVDGDKILRKKDINIGMAAALPSGNLIVPVIKGADSLNLVGLAKTVNDLANRARDNKLKPDEIQGGTFTLTNVGTFGNVMGTPIINQPQVAIMAAGAIRKKPAVLETEQGDVIAIRHMMFLSLSYDHRVVDGSLGGSFLKRVSDYLEAFEINREV
jgi:2-oxoglutarate dehydrogenase E2 component (dihydrolipoamide succinyltransferase)